MKRKILIAPLDWGLGHATRCIPVIRELITKGHDVHIATSGLAYFLLVKEFPTVMVFQLPSYKATYATRLPLLLKVFIQVPYFLYVIWKEHKQIAKLVKQHQFDCIISDNRYGCFSQEIQSVFITHQVNILLPNGFSWLQECINFFNHRLISNFDECWVPDFGRNGITGKLTESKTLSIFYIGMLSRFHKRNEPISKEYNLLVLLSGPEPQRSIFESIVLQQLKSYDGKYLVVRGLPDTQEQTPDCIVNHLVSEQLQQAIESSEMVLSRSGYTTLMDLYFLEKQAIFVPTPGQTEQEYLAMQLYKRGISFFMPQQDFSLQHALAQTKKFTGFHIQEQSEWNTHLDNWLSRF